MGCYDTVILECKTCGSEIEVQSKADECAMREFRKGREIPISIITDIDGELVQCRGCGHSYRLKAKNGVLKLKYL